MYVCVCVRVCVLRGNLKFAFLSIKICLLHKVRIITVTSQVMPTPGYDPLLFVCQDAAATRSCRGRRWQSPILLLLQSRFNLKHQNTNATNSNIPSIRLK